MKRRGLRLMVGMALVCLYPTLMAQTTLRTDTIQEVVVTGTGTQHLLKNAPVQTEVISRRMLDSYGGKSIEEILSGLTASFAFAEGDMGSQMQMGGLGNSYILILIDGKRIHGDVGGENDLGLIDPQRRAECYIWKRCDGGCHQHHHKKAYTKGTLCRKQHALWNA